MTKCSVSDEQDLTRTSSVCYDENCNLNIIPQQRTITSKPNSQKHIVTVGDLHSNAVKMLYFLIRESVLDCNEETYRKLKNLCECKLPSQKQLKDFMALLSKLTVKNNIAVRFIGDMLADRGTNDIYVLLILAFLKMKKVDYDIVLSNHDQNIIAEFTFGLSNLFGYSDSQSQSSQNLAKLCEKKVIFHDSLNRLFIMCYLPHLNLISYNSSTDGKSLDVFTHAPIFPGVLDKLAKVFDIENKDNECKTPKDLIEKINRLNVAVKKFMQSDELKRYLQRTNDVTNENDNLFFMNHHKILCGTVDLGDENKNDNYSAVDKLGAVLNLILARFSSNPKAKQDCFCGQIKIKNIHGHTGSPAYDKLCSLNTKNTTCYSSAPIGDAIPIDSELGKYSEKEYRRYVTSILEKGNLKESFIEAFNKTIKSPKVIEEKQTEESIRKKNKRDDKLSLAIMQSRDKLNLVIDHLESIENNKKLTDKQWASRECLAIKSLRNLNTMVTYHGSSNNKLYQPMPDHKIETCTVKPPNFQVAQFKKWLERNRISPLVKINTKSNKKNILVVAATFLVLAGIAAAVCSLFGFFPLVILASKVITLTVQAVVLSTAVTSLSAVAVLSGKRVASKTKSESMRPNLC